MPDRTAPRRAPAPTPTPAAPAGAPRKTPEIKIAAWWLDTEGTLGKILGAEPADALEMFAALDPEEREAYHAILLYRLLGATAEQTMWLRRLDARLARQQGATTQRLDRIANVMVKVGRLVDAGIKEVVARGGSFGGEDDDVDEEEEGGDPDGDEDDDLGDADPGDVGEGGGEGGDDDLGDADPGDVAEEPEAAPTPRRRRRKGGNAAGGGDS